MRKAELEAAIAEAAKPERSSGNGVAGAEAQLERYDTALRRARLDAGLTIGELADAAGLPVGTVHLLDVGNRKSPVEAQVAEKIAKVLGISVDRVTATIPGK